MTVNELAALPLLEQSVALLDLDGSTLAACHVQTAIDLITGAKADGHPPASPLFAMGG